MLTTIKNMGHSVTAFMYTNVLTILTVLEQAFTPIVLLMILAN